MRSGFAVNLPVVTLQVAEKSQPHTTVQYLISILLQINHSTAGLAARYNYSVLSLFGATMEVHV